jgi:hypothetical protein
MTFAPFSQEGRGAGWELIFLSWTLIGLFFGSQLYGLSALGFGMPTTWGRAFASGLADWYVWGALAEHEAQQRRP